MNDQAYRVQLEVFKGPLDLLLHLIEQQELDITLVSLAQITDQYLEYIHRQEQIPPDDLAEFVAIAARLLLIKSRVLLPRPSQPEEQEPDPGDDLVRQLREYRQFKRIAEILAERDSDGFHSYARTSLPPEWAHREPRVDISGLSLDELQQALYGLLKQACTQEPDFRITPHKVTIDQRIDQIRGAVQARGAITFESVLDDPGSRMEIIITLLALLEMIRHQQIRVTQKNTFGQIVIESDLPPATCAGNGDSL